MEIVEAGTTCRFIVSIMTTDGRDIRVELRVEEMKRMTREEKREIGTGVVEEMFDGMHRET